MVGVWNIGLVIDGAYWYVGKNNGAATSLANCVSRVL